MAVLRASDPTNPFARVDLVPPSFSYEQFPSTDLIPTRTRSVSVCLPARDESATVAAIVGALAGLQSEGLIDQLVVVDDSEDDTAALAEAAGAEVYDQSLLMPQFGPVLGKGDAMWRALSVLHGDVIVFLDADTEDFPPHFVCGLLGPILASTDPASFVKASYRRPLRVGEMLFPTGGGRVTDLTARPLLRRFFPALAGMRQPLAGEIAADAGLLRALPFRTGYGVDVGLLIDALLAVGPEGLAQVDLGARLNRHQPLAALHDMACEVSDTILDRSSRMLSEGVVERPPMASVLPSDLVAAS